MDLVLVRSYAANGTNGALFFNGRQVCFTIELPWKANRAYVSCIPEGRYRLTERFSVRWGLHLWVRGVEGRSLILLHPANNALKQLRGCIAPVRKLVAPGMGWHSVSALSRLHALVFPVLHKQGDVFLTIKSDVL